MTSPSIYVIVQSICDKNEPNRRPYKVRHVVLGSPSSMPSDQSVNIQGREGEAWLEQFELRAQGVNPNDDSTSTITVSMESWHEVPEPPLARSALVLGAAQEVEHARKLLSDLVEAIGKKANWKHEPTPVRDGKFKSIGAWIKTKDEFLVQFNIHKVQFQNGALPWMEVPEGNAREGVRYLSSQGVDITREGGDVGLLGTWEVIPYQQEGVYLQDGFVEIGR